MATKTKKSIEIREKSKKDYTPSWDNVENMTLKEYKLHWHYAMQFYNINASAKDLKPSVLKWMQLNDYDADTVKAFKNTKDWRSSLTMGSVAACLLRGMPPVREGFNYDKDSSEWLRNSIQQVIDAEETDSLDEDGEPVDMKKPKPIVNIQERVRDAALGMMFELDDAIDSWITDADKFDPSALKVSILLKRNNANAAHARVIKSHYAPALADLTELSNLKPKSVLARELDESEDGPGNDFGEQLREAYSGRSRKQIRNLIAFYKEIDSSCDMIIAEGKAKAKPRAAKTISKEKIISGVKYMKSFEPLKLVSINPISIIDCTTLWVYQTKTRKLGKYVAADKGKLSVKGTTIIGYDEENSIQRTLTKPTIQMDEFKQLTKLGLVRYFNDNLQTVITKLNGRINEDIIIFKAV